MKITHNPDHRPLRAAAYPSVGDQLDALWKIVEALTTHTAPPPDALAVYAQVQSVKAKYRNRSTK